MVRLIRMLVEFWDRVSLSEQENMFGRRRDTGAPLDGDHELDVPNYAEDPIGEVDPADQPHPAGQPAHPADGRPAGSCAGLQLRPRHGRRTATSTWAWSSSATSRTSPRQFEAVQERLADEPLVDYISPFGGGYFFALPGVRDADD